MQLHDECSQELVLSNRISIGYAHIYIQHKPMVLELVQSKVPLKVHRYMYLFSS